MLKLLIIDDDVEGVKLLSKVLDVSAHGVEIEITQAFTLEEGLRISPILKPDLTFMDLIMPGSEIDDVLAAVKKMHQPVIICSGMPAQYYRPGKDISLLAEIYGSGAQDFVEKGSERFTQIQTIMLRTLLRIYTPKTLETPLDNVVE